MSARRICGELEKRTEQAQASTININLKQGNAIPYEQNNRTYLKVWLIDGSVNKNEWGVTPQSISKNINTAIGKPLILYQNTGHEPDHYRRTAGEYDHPYLAGVDSVEHALAYQDLFRVGTFIDVFESDTNKGEWWGVAEVTDEDTRRAIREDPKLPMYVSPMIHLLDHTEPENAHSRWSFFHSAIVGRPAYGATKAYISGQCSGSKDTCLLQLRKAAISANNNEIGCGFCRYKAMKAIQANLRQASASNVSSLDKIGQQNKNRYSSMSEQNNNQNDDQQNNNTKNQEQEEEQEQQQQQTTAEQRGNVNPQTGAPSQMQQTETNPEQVEESKKVNKQSKKPASDIKEAAEIISSQATKIKSLEMQLATARADVETHKQINTQFETRLASLEKVLEAEKATARAEQITAYVNSAPAYKLLTAQDREKQIETFVKGSMSVDEIRNIIEPLNASVAKQYNFPNRIASSSTTKPRLSLGTPQKSIEVRAASESEQEEEVPYYLSLAQQMRGNGGNGGIQ